MQQGDFINVPALNSLQPRQPTTGNVDLLLPLQPKLLVPLTMDRRDSNRNPMESTLGGSGLTGFGMTSTLKTMPSSASVPCPAAAAPEEVMLEPKVTLHNDSAISTPTSFNDGHDTPSGDEV
uniref:(northern house mosquito) hypothetical protein n=3 Tax=Culex pipiens TaxID=7175 RepID=A0A8D8CI90_CULPI